MSVDTSGDLFFYTKTVDGNPPWIDGNPKLGWTASNFVRIPTKVPIHDLRGKEDQLNIDINGFEVLNYNGHVHDVFDDHSDEQKSYYDDITHVLKNRLGASRVVIFCHVIRSRGPICPAEQCDETHKNPVFYPHVDNDPISAKCKVKEILGEEESIELLKYRFQIINIWRPLGPNPVINIPLSICDYQTLDLNNDIHLADVKASISTTSLYTISKNANDRQKWCYLSNMKSNEMFVFKMFDSDSKLAQFGAHTAFVNQNASPNNLKQSSIEMRCLVFYDQEI